jgi:hypothetical protein
LHGDDANDHGDPPDHDKKQTIEPFAAGVLLMTIELTQFIVITAHLRDLSRRQAFGSVNGDFLCVHSRSPRPARVRNGYAVLFASNA